MKRLVIVAMVSSVMAFGMSRDAHAQIGIGFGNLGYGSAFGPGFGYGYGPGIGYGSGIGYGIGPSFGFSRGGYYGYPSYRSSYGTYGGLGTSLYRYGGYRPSYTVGRPAYPLPRGGTMWRGRCR